MSTIITPTAVTKALSRWIGLYLCTLGYLWATNNSAFAQVTSDGTVNTEVNTDGNTAEITGGETRGDNLFHSFEDFSVETGNEAFFNNADSIANIFSRVTGGNVSDIDGAIRANGSASLFLINPAGIVFGENASLNIGGSFFGSSASSILFKDGEFSATDLENPPLLTVNAPIGLGFRDQPGDIVNRSRVNDGNGLQVLPGLAIGLIGGDVKFEGGRVFAPGGIVELGGLAEAGTIDTNEQGNLVFPDGVSRSDVNLTETSLVGVGATGDGGEIRINTDSLNVNNESELLAIGGTEVNRQGKGGEVIINATDDISFANNSRISVFGGQAGSIQLDAQNLSITSGSSFFAGIPNDSGFPEAQSGDININLAEDLVLDELNSENGTFITNTSFGIGNPGDININARNITFQNGGQISIFSTSQQDGNIGEVNLNAGGNILFDGIASQRSGILNAIPDGSSGDIGAINVQAQNLTITNGATINSQVSGNADGGDINVDVANSIKIDGFSGLLASQISSNVFITGKGDGGTININAQKLELSRNGSISSDNLGEGNGGNIDINAEEINIGQQGNSNISPSFISAETFSGSKGNGGNITISTNSLLISDGGDIEVGTGGTGNGGNIKINARDVVSVDGTGVLLNSESPSTIAADAFNSVGNAGNIEIDTAKLSVTNGAFVSANILSDGTVTNTSNGGSIVIRASDSVKVSGTAGIVVDIIPEDATGNGGDLTIETGKLTVEDGASISAISLGEGNAGSLTINATESIELRGFTETGRGGIFASALQGSGNAGNVSIFTNKLTIADGASIATSNFPSLENSDFPPGTGQPGSINIQANSIRLENEGRIEAATQSEIGDSANINLTVADDITIEGNSFISARALNNADGGNLKIDTNFVVAFPSNGNGNDIIASAAQGEGGNITINAESLLGIAEGSAVESNNSNDIDASSQVFGLDGTVTINTLDIDPLQGSTELPSNIVEAKQTADQTCAADRDGKATNGLVIAGRGGVTPPPDAPLNSENINNENPAQASIPEPIETALGKIQPARGIMFTKSGRIILTAYPTNNAGERIPEIKNNCGQI
jgi:filamentous hemagglutinin family protein